jgi:hypothetical protein
MSQTQTQSKSQDQSKPESKTQSKPQDQTHLTLPILYVAGIEGGLKETIIPGWRVVVGKMPVGDASDAD